MRSGKAERLVEAPGVGPRGIGGQLKKRAAGRPRLRLGIRDQLRADALAAQFGADTDALDLGPAAAPSDRPDMTIS